MIKINIRADIRGLKRQLDEFQKKNLRYATARALTATAKIAVTDIQTAMRSNFTQVSPYTLNAFYAKPATKDDPTAYVAARDFAGKGTPAWKYLTPEIEGGSRRLKPFERRLGIGYLVPGRAAGIGPAARAEIVRVLAQLNALADTQVAAVASNPRWRKRGKARRGQTEELRNQALQRRPQYFLGKSKSGQLGIYRVISSGQVVRIFSVRDTAPQYAVRLPYRAIVERSASLNFPIELRKALAQAMATARR